MSNITNRLRAESIAQQQIRKRLGPLVTLIEQMDSLYDRTTNAIAEHPQPSSATKVGLILADRLANDLRVCSLAGCLGYGLQALVLAGTVVELVGALSYVGDSDSRAVSWAEHTDRRHTYPPKVDDGIEATLTALGISDPAVKDNWKQAYAFMCEAKHANPRLSLIHGLRIDSSGAYHAYGPDCSDLGTNLSARALWYAVGFGTFGIIVALGHCSDDALQAQLRTEARSINERLRGLESWYLDVIGPESPLKSQKEASALLSEAQRLQSETKQLRRETERMKQETRRLQQETEKARRARTGRRLPSA